MIDITAYLQHFQKYFPTMAATMPWAIVQHTGKLIEEKLQTLNDDYLVSGNVAIHRSARVEEHVIIKGPAVISESCFIGAHAYLRGGVFLAEKVTIGPGCEIKTCIILKESALAHFNFAGDSIVGSNVNLEAGAVIANHYNERTEKEIAVYIDGKIVLTKVTKFGALIGDNTKIGANAVLSPGTILKPNSVVKRLMLVEQC